ncbi:MAG: XkdX family protein [Eubacteriales bacterium]|jgi:hypothetical protein
MTYEIVKHNYERGLWNKTIVKLAVKKGVITPEQYKEITGDDYEAKNQSTEQNES